MRTALLLFAFGLLLRILFWVATPDRGAAWSFAFQGDAPVWQDLAQKLATGRPDELLALPLRPPGMLWLVAALWDGTGSGIVVRLCFAVLGALVAPLVFGLLRPHLPAPIATGSALLCAASSNLIVLGSGPHVELPYLVLVLASFHDQERLRAGRGLWTSARWGALHALATLLRAEHVLTFGLLWLLVLWQRKARRWPIP
ncbi:MAG: hypothetical protein FJ265_18820, partial [Planctomycetes bacterium]|nr:hypothetical protein [Planctomycetota bacterium]